MMDMKNSTKKTTELQDKNKSIGAQVVSAQVLCTYALSHFCSFHLIVLSGYVCVDLGRPDTE